MNLLNKVAKNYGVVVLGDILSRAINLFIFLALARYLGTTKLGEYNFIFVYLYFFEVFIQFGMNPIITREISRDRSLTEIIIGNSVLIRTVFIFLAIILASIIITFLNYPESTKFLVYFASLSLFFNLRTIYEATFKVNLAMVYPVMFSVIKKLIYGGICFLIIWLKGTLFHLIFASLLSGFIDLLLIIYLSKKYALPRFRFDASICKSLLKESLPLAFSGVFTAIYFRIDVFMLSLLKGYQSVGYYSVAYNLTEALHIIPIALMVSLFPLMSSYFNKLKENFINLVQWALGFMLLVGLPIAIGTSILSSKIIFLLYGNRYLPASCGLTILIWVNLFMFFNIILTNALIAANRQKVDMFISLIASILNIVLNLLLIPYYDFKGAAIATGITELFILLFLFYYINRLAGLKMHFKFLSKILGANLILFIFFALKIIQALPLFVVIIFSIIIYVILIIVFRIVNRNELQDIKKLLVAI